MKRRIIAGVVWVGFLFSAMQGDNNQQITQALSRGDATGLGSFFAKSIELSINAKTSFYSNNQAQLMVKDFFAQNKVMSYQVINAKANNLQSAIVLGDIKTNNGAYRVTYVLDPDNKRQIKSLRFDLK